jgi:hypothetical protein
MRRYLSMPAVLAALALGACDDAGPLEPADPVFGAARAGSPALGIMSWNIYVGADLTQLLAVGSELDIPCAVYGVWTDVVATDFAARAVAIVDQIEAYGPHVIGLNEVSTFDFMFDTTEDLVFLDVLEDELESRGLAYSVPVDPVTDRPAVSTNFEVTLPIAYTDECPAQPQDAISYTEFDVILVRDDVTYTGADNGNYAQPLPLPVPGDVLLKLSGWASVDIVHKDLPYRVFATHIEPADTGPCETGIPELLWIHNQQAGEMMGLLDGLEIPTILVGDLNSDASGCTTPTYPNLIDAGFVDAWTLGRPRGDGFTSNQADDLLNVESQLFHRIDFVLYRDAFTSETGQFQGSAHTELVGEAQDDRTAGGLWPSDHAGVMAELRIAPGRGHAD